MPIQVTCINKSGGYHADPHHAIEHLGWINDQTRATGKSTRIQVYDWLKNNGGAAYVRDSRGNTAQVAPREHANGTRFVQTYADKVWSDNLLALPECP